MRILGFSKMWPKLTQGWEFTTFRLPRLDKDWQPKETVQIVLKPRSKERVLLGTAEIRKVEPRQFPRQMIKLSLQHGVPYITDSEAKIDGFNDLDDMFKWMLKTHGHDDRFLFEPINKLILRWVTMTPILYSKELAR
jgi:hypothetical protein